MGLIFDIQNVKVTAPLAPVVDGRSLKFKFLSLTNVHLFVVSKFAGASSYARKLHSYNYVDTVNFSLLPPTLLLQF